MRRDTVSALLDAGDDAPTTDGAAASAPTAGAAPEAPRLPASALAARGGFLLLAVLAGINLLDYLDSAILTTAGPDIQRSLHLTDAGLGAVGALGPAFFVLAAVPVGQLSSRRRRTPLAAACAAVAGVATLGTALSGRPWQLGVSRLVTGAGQSSILPVHTAVIADRWPEGVRARAIALHSAAGTAAGVLGPLLVAVCALAVGDSRGWRLAFAASGLLVLLLALVCRFLADPRPAGETQVSAEERRLVTVEAGVSRLLAVPSLRWLLGSIGVLGFVLVGAPTFVSVLLDHRFHRGALDRGLLLAVTDLASIAGLVVGGALHDRLRESGARAPLRLLAAATAAFGVLAPVAVLLPSLGAVVVGLALARFAFSLGSVAVYAHIAAVAPVRLRALAFSLLGLVLFVLGGFLGSVLTGLLSDAYGSGPALAVVIGPACLVSAALALRAGRDADADVAAAADDEVADAAERELLASLDPAEVPALQVRGLAVGYGGLRVLHGVDLDVAPGEVLALLGTNGAGKSTLLRAVSGLLVPERGTVRIAGRSVTEADPAARVRLGVVQVAGGRGVFPSMSVADNLLAGAHVYGWDNARITAAVDDVLDLLPALRPRLGQRAGTLSGGEQQMLALAKALLLQPSVLLVDELSLGLAPAVVAELMALVGRLRERGIAVVVVEQSVNVALELADRAVFLEKGRVRFSGPARELLGRDDLLRAVFLGRATPPPARRRRAEARA